MKSNQKCVRMSDEVLEYVNQFQGEGFNQKFENLVLYFKKTEQKYKENLNLLNREISKKQEVTRKLNGKINNLIEIEGCLTSIQSDCKTLHKKAQFLINK